MPPSAAKKAYMRAYYQHHKERWATKYSHHYQPVHRIDYTTPLAAPAPPCPPAIPPALVAQALSGIPERWREADVYGDGAYLWHCDAWRKVDAMPFLCPSCDQRFFEKE